MKAPKEIRELAENPELLEIGRKAIEDELVEWRDSTMFSMRNNGFTIKHRDGLHPTLSDSVLKSD